MRSTPNMGFLKPKEPLLYPFEFDASPGSLLFGFDSSLKLALQ